VQGVDRPVVLQGEGGLSKPCFASAAAPGAEGLCVVQGRLWVSRVLHELVW
jgi:hypothetical protein